MTKTKHITDPELGEIKLTKYKNGKYIRIRVRYEGVQVSLPYSSRFDEALNFVETKRAWIKTELEKLKQKKAQLNFFDINKDTLVDNLKRKAHAYLPIRIRQLALKHKLSFNKLSLRNSKTRWGSCSVDNNINLNIHLMKLPDELIDYVILHELAHTIHKNHSKNFWDFLSELLGINSKEIDKKLKLYSTDLNL